MSNYKIRLDLLRLQGVFARNLKGNSTCKRCLIIPLDDNPSIFLGEKGCYLNLTAYETQNNQYGDTHILKPDFPKDVREHMTEEERHSVSIIGNMRPMQPRQAPVTGIMSSDNFVDDQGGLADMPF